MLRGQPLRLRFPALPALRAPRALLRPRVPSPAEVVHRRRGLPLSWGDADQIPVHESPALADRAASAPLRSAAAGNENEPDHAGFLPCPGDRVVRPFRGGPELVDTGQAPDLPIRVAERGRPDCGESGPEASVVPARLPRFLRPDDTRPSAWVQAPSLQASRARRFKVIA